MKKLTAFFVILVIGVLFSLGMTIYAAMKTTQLEEAPAPVSIPTPAIK